MKSTDDDQVAKAIETAIRIAQKDGTLSETSFEITVEGGACWARWTVTFTPTLSSAERDYVNQVLEPVMRSFESPLCTASYFHEVR